MNKNNDLALALATRNAATLAWVAEDPANRWACTLVEDLDHWAKNGVTTADELHHYLLVCEAFEVSRSAWGYKPYWAGLMSMSNEELEERIASDMQYIRQQEEDEEEYARQELLEEEAHQQAVAAAMTPSGHWTIGDLVSI